MTYLPYGGGVIDNSLYLYGNPSSTLESSREFPTNSLATTTSYTYGSDSSDPNNNGQLTGTTINGDTTNYGYDAYGQQTKAWMSNLTAVNYQYTSGYLSTISTGTAASTGSVSTTDKQNYYLTYDGFGNITQVSVGSYTLATYTYISNNGLLSGITYGNGFTVNYIYDFLDRILEIRYNGTVRFFYTYNGNGQISSVHDYSLGTIYNWEYDLNGYLLTEVIKDSDGYYLGNYYKYDSYGNIKTDRNSIQGSYTYTYDYDDASLGDNYGLLTSMETASDDTHTYYYDYLNRLEDKYTNVYNKEYTYKTVTNNYQGTSMLTETDLVSSLYYGFPNGGSKNYSYTYNLLGYITSVTAGTTVQAYYLYDELGQLILERLPVKGYSFVYTYDSRGNLTSAKKYSGTSHASPELYERYATLLHTDTYYYAPSTVTWKDYLVKFNGDYISYDSICNPTNYYNGSYYDLTWQNGRELSTLTKSSGSTYTYTYNLDGLRTSKTDGSTTYKYYWEGDRLLSMIWGSSCMFFYYDEAGMPYSLCYNGTTYYYLLNLQGDVMGLLNTSGSVVAYYEYDAWGNILDCGGLSSTDCLAMENNPFRYRSYMYDTESGFYYLQSRYYDPVTRRFINSDSQVNYGSGLTGCNLFVYCANNPVMGIDPYGCSWSDFCDVCSDFWDGSVDGFLGTYTGLWNSVTHPIATVKSYFTHPDLYSVYLGPVFGPAIKSDVNLLTNFVNGDAYGAGVNIGNRAGEASLALASYAISKGISCNNNIENDIIDLKRSGSAAWKTYDVSDNAHCFTDIVDNYAGYATKTPINNGALYQLQGSLRGVDGRFEWIVQNGEVTHRMFIKGGGMNGIPILP